MVHAKTLSIISVCKFIVYVSNIFLLLIHRLDKEVTPGIGEQYCMVDLITGEIWGKDNIIPLWTDRESQKTNPKQNHLGAVSI